jgi:hypothetical protein
MHRLICIKRLSCRQSYRGAGSSSAVCDVKRKGEVYADIRDGNPSVAGVT